MKSEKLYGLVETRIADDSGYQIADSSKASGNWMNWIVETESKGR